MRPPSSRAGSAQRSISKSARLAVAARDDSKEGLDVRVGGRVAVPVVVGAVARGAAVPRDAREEGLDVGVGALVAVVVEVGGAVAAHRAGAPRGEAAGADAAGRVKVPTDDQPVVPRQEAEDAGERRRADGGFAPAALV